MPYELGYIKIELINKGKSYGHNCSDCSALGVHFINFVLDNNNWDITNEK